MTSRGPDLCPSSNTDCVLLLRKSFIHLCFSTYSVIVHFLEESLVGHFVKGFGEIEQDDICLFSLV